MTYGTSFAALQQLQKKRDFHIKSCQGIIDKGVKEEEDVDRGKEV